MFTTYSSGSSQDSLHAEIGRRPQFGPRRTRLAVLVAASALFGAVSPRDIRPSTRRSAPAQGRRPQRRPNA